MKSFLIKLFYYVKLALFQFLAGRKGLELLDELVIIAPHPDDETLGCGELISLAVSSGRNVRVIVVSDGAMSHLNCCDISMAELVANRRLSCQKAMEILGVAPQDLIFGNFPDSKLAEHFEEIKSWLLSLLLEKKVQIFVPYKFEEWQDHQVIQKIGEELVSGTGNEGYYYLVWSYLYGMSLKKLKKYDWKGFLVIKSVKAFKMKKKAVRIYQHSLAPCGKPFAGVLPKELWRATVNRKELYFPICNQK